MQLFAAFTSCSTGSIEIPLSYAKYPECEDITDGKSYP
jgi:hypothetical protein